MKNKLIDSLNDFNMTLEKLRMLYEDILKQKFNLNVNDIVKMFLFNNVVVGKGYKVSKRDLYNAYLRWVASTHFRAIKMIEFNRILSKFGYDFKRTSIKVNSTHYKVSVCWLGFKLKGE